MKLSLKKWYRILAPRPVVLVSTVNDKGVSNAAPFSFVMPVSGNPPLIAFASSPGHETAKNILKTGDFIVNIPSQEILKELWICADDIPEGVSEITTANLTEEKSAKVKSPRIKECFAHYECRLTDHRKTGDHLLIIGEVLLADIKDGLMKEEKFEITKANALMHIRGAEFGLLGNIIKAK